MFIFTGELFPSEPDILEVENLARRVAHTDLSMFYGTLAAFYLKGDAQAVVKQVLTNFNHSWQCKLACFVSSGHFLCFF